MNISKSPEDIWNEFWRSLCTKEDGLIDLEQIKKELADYYYILDQVPKVYEEVSGGTLSKPNYPATTVIKYYEDRVNDIVKDRFDEVIGELEKEIEWMQSVDEHSQAVGIMYAIEIVQDCK